MKNHLISGLLIVAIAATAAADDKPSFKITNRRDNDTNQTRQAKKK